MKQANKLTVGRHARNIGTVAFLPDGSRMITDSEDGTIRAWRVEGGEDVSGNGRWLIVGTGPGRDDSRQRATVKPCLRSLSQLIHKS